jgi:hypothetical protein
MIGHIQPIREHFTSHRLANVKCLRELVELQQAKSSQLVNGGEANWLRGVKRLTQPGLRRPELKKDSGRLIPFAKLHADCCQIPRQLADGGHWSGEARVVRVNDVEEQLPTV